MESLDKLGATQFGQKETPHAQCMHTSCGQLQATALPAYIAEILETLEANGFEAYVVGGCVRDALRGHAPQDWDVTTNALPEDVKACFLHARTLETGVKHGTVTVIIGDNQAEITTYRVDGAYSDHRRPDSVTFTRQLESDLARRDFTMNALAYHPARGLVDLFGGAADLQNRRIVCVGDATARFSEDALRILRAARFASVLGFEIDMATSDAMDALAHLLDNISPERVAAEISKALTGDGIAEVLRNHTRVILQVLPELAETVGFCQHTKYHHLDVWLHTVEAVNASPPDLVLRLTMLLHDCGKPKCFTLGNNGEGHFYGHAERSARLADAALCRLRFDNATRAEVVYLIRHHCDEIRPDVGLIKRMLNKMGEERLCRMMMVHRADCAAKAPAHRAKCERAFDKIDAVIDDIIAQHQAFSLKDLAVNGDDLIEIGFAKGKTIGDALDALLALVMDDKLANTRQALLAHAKSLLK